MEVVMPMILLLMKLCFVCIVLAVQGSGAHRQLTSPPVTRSPDSQTTEGILSPTTSVVSPQYGTAPPLSKFEGHFPSMPPRTPVSVPVAPVPVASPSSNFPQIPPASHPSAPGTLPPSGHQKSAPENNAPIPVSVPSPPRIPKPEPPAGHPVSPIASPPIQPVPVESPTSKSQQSAPSSNPVMPGESPSVVPDPNLPPSSSPPTMPVAPSPNDTPEPVPPVNHSPTRDPSGSPASTPSPRMPVAAPPVETPQPVPPRNHSHTKAPAEAPSKHKAIRHSNDAPAPSPLFLSPKSPTISWFQSPASSPSTLIYKNHHRRSKTISPAPASSYLVSPPALEPRGPVMPPPSLPPKPSRRHYPPPPLYPGPSASPSYFHSPSPLNNVSPAPSPSPIAASGHTKFPLISPKVSPSEPSSASPKMPPLPPVLTLPPPPPNEDCSATLCKEPYTNAPPGSPCDCVWPMQVGLRLSVSLYTFFPLVSELAKEISAGVFVKQSQVRIIGANAANQQPEKTIVLIDLVPLGDKFDNTTAFLTYDRFWHKQVFINTFYFGDYEVLYVQYPGLPPSPPSAPSGVSVVDDRPFSGNGNNGRTIKPIGVDVHKKQNKSGLNGSIIAIISTSAFLAVIVCSVVVWVFLFKNRERNFKKGTASRALLPSLAKTSGMAGSMIGSVPSSVSLSFGSSIATYTGSARTFSTSDIKKATNNFDSSRILGEGGFGRVYSGVLEDGTKAAVKVLKRDDHQGGREFLAEVEMLSRLHHRNLVKLIGICTEERTRCLVYELIPNGSVESHLHGVDKETSPLDWSARMKIALGAARGLAYLHEDSSPRVIHRDFKSSNILLEHDFTPKVSDFGLARTALDEENRHILTRVMGTFGYVAPEYAMTGHLLVKSDVYSYGVVLLELLSGRKPVDMSQPSGQENLVAWARPFLSSEDGLESIIDTSLGSNIPFDSVAKVAAIASMCVQPEVSHRPFMGEVVQALKLVCNECDETKEVCSRSSSHEDLSIDVDATVSTGSGQLPGPNYDSGLDVERALLVSELLGASVSFERRASGSFRRHSSSGPLRPGRGRQFWQRMRRLSGGSASEHEVIFSLWPGSE